MTNILGNNDSSVKKSDFSRKIYRCQPKTASEKNKFIPSRGYTMKRIAIIGGGISGLTVLHYLKQRLGDSVEITLFEREASTGGTIRSFKKGPCLFEWGPDGFLDNQPASLALIRELGLTDRLIEAAPTANRRYIQMNGNLHAVPMDPLNFIRTPLLSSNDKWSLVAGIFKKDISTDCSIYDYVSRRFSPDIAQLLVDPLISGIYAGDIKRLHLSAFPKLKRKGFRGLRMLSFKWGMGEIIEALDKRYQKHIQTNSEMFSAKIDADAVIVATPAHAAAKIVEDSNPLLAQILTQVPYAPVAVAGLLFQQGSFKKKPDGFGYLIPSKENKDVLGVLIESNVYDGRAGDDEMMMRVMLGGAHHPAIINEGQEKIIGLAIKEIDSIYGLISGPLETFVKLWPQAIPQYELNYPNLYQSIRQQCAKTPGLYLCANYLDGISFNDCIYSAKVLAGIIG
jgi:oxygen-dependent protoporphyrinogen oxidase